MNKKRTMHKFHRDKNSGQTAYDFYNNNNKKNLK